MTECPRVRVVEPGDALRAELVRSLARAGFEVAAATAVGDPGDRDGLFAHAVHVVDWDAPGADVWARDAEARRRTIFLARSFADLRAADREANEKLDLLRKPFSSEQLEARIQALLGPLDRAWLARFDPLLETCDPRLARTFERALRIAGGEGPICIEGELGTGRRALAHAIHLASPRAAGPRIELDPAAFVGAGGEASSEQIERAVVAARRGVLLVCEPLDWPIHAQRSLCRALEACAPDLEPRCVAIGRTGIDRTAQDGRFEVALAYRLAGAQLSLPPLRERALDQATLCRALARRVARELGQTAPVVDEALVAALALDGFPGNRLGVESRLRSALIEGRTDRLAQSVSAEARSSRPNEDERLPALELRTLERDAIVRALAREGGNRTHAARVLGISVRTLRNKLHVYGLR